MRWIETYDWRGVEPFEKAALFAFWREVGEGLGISELPTTCAEFEAWGHAYEATKFKPTAASAGLTTHLIELASGWGPACLPASRLARAIKRQLIIWLLCALCRNPAVVECIGLGDELRRMPTFLILALRGAALARAALVRYLLPPRPISWPGTICGARADATEAGTEPSPLDGVRYRCPYDAISYRDHGTYRLQDLGHPVDAYPVGGGK